MSWTTCTAWNEEQGKKYLQRINPLNAQWANAEGNANWDYESNITDETLAKKVRNRKLSPFTE